jgi:hypothetical protein
MDALHGSLRRVTGGLEGPPRQGIKRRKVAKKESLMSTKLMPAVMLAVTVTLGIVPASARAASLSYTPRVRVDVYADNLASKIRSCLTRELQQLPGVTIVESEPEWIIDVIGFQSLNRAKRVIGYALSVVIVEALDAQPLDDDLLFDSDPFTEVESRPRLRRIAAGSVSPASTTPPTTLQDLKDHRLAVGSLQELKKLCREIATDFDARHLEPMRQLLQQPAEEGTDLLE